MAERKAPALETLLLNRRSGREKNPVKYFNSGFGGGPLQQEDNKRVIFLLISLLPWTTVQDHALYYWARLCPVLLARLCHALDYCEILRLALNCYARPCLDCCTWVSPGHFSLDPKRARMPQRSGQHCGCPGHYRTQLQMSLDAQAALRLPGCEAM